MPIMRYHGFRSVPVQGQGAPSRGLHFVRRRHLMSLRWSPAPISSQREAFLRPPIAQKDGASGKRNSTANNEDLARNAINNANNSLPPTGRTRSSRKQAKPQRFLVRDTGAVQTVLKDKAILSKIFASLPALYLKSCREVNKLWNEIGSETLKRNQDLYTLWTLDLASNGYELCSALCKEPLSLQEYIWAASPNFPSTDFRFLNGNLNVRDAQNFFEAFGTRILSLELDIYASKNAIDGEYTSQPTFQNLLLYQLKSLVSLNLQTLPKKWLAKELPLLPDPAAKLENLRVLEVSPRCSAHSGLVQRLVGLSVNLERFVGFHPAYTPAFASEKKRATIQTFLIHPTTDFLNHFEKLSFIPKIGELMLEFDLDMDEAHFKRAVACLSKVLKGNTDSLKTARGFHPMALFSKMALPVMTSVERVVLSGSDAPSRDIGAPNPLWLQKLFPALRVVELGFWCLTENLEELFSLGPLQSVRTLKFAETEKLLDPACIPKLAKVFPSVRNLIIGGTSKYAEVLKVLWSKFPSLECLRVDLLIDAIVPKGAEASSDGHIYHKRYYAELDSAITGICVETLTSMYLKGTVGHGETGDSIRNMTNLKKFEIVIKGIPETGIPEGSLFSRLSIEHGFFMVPAMDMMVHISPGNYRADLMKALEPIRKYAKITL